MNKTITTIKQFLLQINPKKHLQVYIVCTITTIILCFYSYRSGIYVGMLKERKDFVTRKGNGTHFYGERKGDYFIYHSIPDCYFINKGIGRDTYFLDKELRLANSRFCPQCMNEELIDKCFDFLESVK